MKNYINGMSAEKAVLAYCRAANKPEPSGIKLENDPDECCCSCTWNWCSFKGKAYREEIGRGVSSAAAQEVMFKKILQYIFECEEGQSRKMSQDIAEKIQNGMEQMYGAHDIIKQFSGALDAAIKEFGHPVVRPILFEAEQELQTVLKKTLQNHITDPLKLSEALSFCVNRKIWSTTLQDERRMLALDAQLRPTLSVTDDFVWEDLLHFFVHTEQDQRRKSRRVTNPCP